MIYFFLQPRRGCGLFKIETFENFHYQAGNRMPREGNIYYEKFEGRKALRPYDLSGVFGKGENEMIPFRKKYKKIAIP